MTRLHRFAAWTICLAALAGCSADFGGSSDDVDLADPEVAQGSRLAPVSTIGDLFELNRPGGPGGEAMPINKYLWRASLKTLEFMPLASTDPFTGVIVTDWSNPPESPDERFKVTVYIEEPELQARSLRVAVFRQVRGEDGDWTSAEVNEATPGRLEDAILTKARQLRVAELEAAAEG